MTLSDNLARHELVCPECGQHREVEPPVLEWVEKGKGWWRCDEYEIEHGGLWSSFSVEAAPGIKESTPDELKEFAQLHSDLIYIFNHSNDLCPECDEAQALEYQRDDDEAAGLRFR